MSKGLVTLIGGSGFIGRYAARALVDAGYRVRVACRRPHLAGDVRLAGAPGWVDLVQANIRNPQSLARACEGADVIVNLVGILSEVGKQSFSDTQAEGARNAADAAKDAGATRFVQVSAIGASAKSRAAYARTKAAGEAAVRDVFPDAVILRPSIVFGPEDGFFNRFAELAKSPAMSVLPFLPAIGSGKTRFQPVYAGDVADAIVAAVSREDALGKTYELGGPGTYTFNELYDFIFETIDVKRFKAPLPFLIAKPMGLTFGALFRYIPPLRWVLGEAPITGGQVEMLKTDNVVANGALTLADLGVTEVESIEAIVPSYLWRFRDYGQFHEETGG
ncbi:MAG: complex I NDUFA9 subunit family protein [Pseudomonadota bacterium]